MPEPLKLRMPPLEADHLAAVFYLVTMVCILLVILKFGSKYLFWIAVCIAAGLGTATASVILFFNDHPLTSIPLALITIVLFAIAIAINVERNK